MEGRIVSKSKEKAGDLFQLVFVLSRGSLRKLIAVPVEKDLFFVQFLPSLSRASTLSYF